MRSFHLLILFLLMSAVFSVYASDALESNSSQNRDFFKVILPYDGQQSVEKNLNEAMTILLVRLTGQKRFLTSRVGQAYLKNPKAWLKTYDITPRLEEGVTVGKNIVYTFLGDKLRQEFQHRFVPIWPLSARPKTLVMGSLVQGRALIKLDDDTLQYRLDAEFRHYPQKMKLPITLPSYLSQQEVYDWIFPVESDKTAYAIQKKLAKWNQNYLLSFKVVMNGQQNNHLTWMLYDSAGERVLAGEMEGQPVYDLTRHMFDQVMTHYVTMNKQVSEDNRLRLQPILLTISNLTQPEEMLVFERLLKSQPEMIRSVALVSMQAGQVQYRITPQVTYQKIQNWIKSWPQSTLTESVPENQTIEIQANLDFSDTLN